jgi:hypothetical protein
MTGAGRPARHRCRLIRHLILLRKLLTRPRRARLRCDAVPAVLTLTGMPEVGFADFK